MLLCLSAISPVRFSFQRQQTPSTSPPAIVPEIFNHEACLIDAVPASNRPWFPYKDEFHLDKPEKQSSSSKVVIASLAEFVEKQMKERFERVVRSRSYSACFVAEALDNAGNIAAIFRSAEAFGFQSVHVITSLTVKGYKGVRRAHRGTERWLDVEVWNCAKDCIQALRSRGYRIAVTSTGHDTVSICEMDWTIPTAVIFGNEHEGASDYSTSEADILCGIPMFGMVDSLNVSVAAGILMRHAVCDRIARNGIHGDLEPEQQEILMAEFFLRYKRNSADIFSDLAKKRQLDQYRNF
ncbi:uncharacterized protein LOC9645676 isoform X1 [Selaginella moellendorffii]|nr:uncharacterized protein LOC9645676 isoform X1 [Selaginella moellendorffii]|eukprot:XP_002970099.2 uncharacterized protein LOC9645676 isoform X1 [Selaginella moellendorffii]